MSLYQNIKALCELHNVPIGTLEAELHIARGYISDWDEHRPSIDRVKLVADRFHVTIDELVNGEINGCRKNH